MDDEEIIELYNSRSESAIKETKQKYDAYLMKIADNILHDKLDDEECVSDTYVRTWNSIPPTHPRSLRAFVGKITRNNALNRVRDENRLKRISPDLQVTLDEIGDLIPAASDIENEIEMGQIIGIINFYLKQTRVRKRVAFIRRYWYLDSIKEISERLGMSESNVKMTLKRQREEIKSILKKEGVYV